MQIKLKKMLASVFVLATFGMFMNVSAPSQAQAGTARFGTLVKDGNFDFKVLGMSCGIQTANRFATASGQYCRVQIWVRNHANKKNMFAVSGQKAVDAKGREYDADTAADIYSGNPLTLKYINPGIAITGFLWFDMPRGDVPKYIELHDSFWSSGVRVYR